VTRAGSTDDAWVGVLPPAVGEALTALTPHAAPALRDGELDRLTRGWTEPHRAYHTLQHLVEMLAALGELAAAGELPREHVAVATVAAAYHDLAYDPRAAPGSNEHRSATWARDHLHRLGAAEPDVDAVEELVLLTVDHDPAAPERTDDHGRVRAAFSDADLWILSAPPARYAAYSRQVRSEYAHVPEPLFRTARAAVLRALTDRPAIYATGHARRSWEHRARANVATEVTALTERVRS
jgi:predicted metal-dependent HD superfamily phosphohydrolase